jgi:hypothetical protein
MLLRQLVQVLVRQFLLGGPGKVGVGKLRTNWPEVLWKEEGAPLRGPWIAIDGWRGSWSQRGEGRGGKGTLC